MATSLLRKTDSRLDLSVLAHIVGAFSGGFIALDGNGLVLAINDEAALLYPLETGENILSVDPPFTTENDMDPVLRSLSGHRVEHLEGRATTADDILHVYAIDAAPVTGDNGAIICVIIQFRDTTSDAWELEQQRGAHAALQSTISGLQSRTEEAEMVSQMTDLLQSCRRQEEFFEIVSMFLSRIFRDEPGGVFIIDDARSQVDLVAAWGAFDGLKSFESERCWALRRGRLHMVGPGQLSPHCDHLRAETERAFCVPMMAQGEALGILHVTKSESWDGDLRSRQRALRSISEHLGLALANLRLRESLRAEAIHDALTGLFNRRHMEASLTRELARCKRHGLSLTVVMADIDHFKAFNDSNGHAAGDELLRAFGDAFGTHFRETDIPCRYGGEEFLVVCPEAEVADTERRVEALRARVEALEVEYRGTLLPTTTVSIGLAMFPLHGSTIDSLIRHADEALYEAKRRGRNRVCVFGKDCSPVDDEAPAAEA